MAARSGRGFRSRKAAAKERLNSLPGNHLRATSLKLVAVALAAAQRHRSTELPQVRNEWSRLCPHPRRLRQVRNHMTVNRLGSHSETGGVWPRN